MLPPAAAASLTELGHDALGVRDAGLAGRTDQEVFDWAVSESRIMVTEDVADYSILLEERLHRGRPCVPLVFVRRSDFPAGSGLAVHVARHLAQWAAAHPEPYLGAHWPTV